MRDGSEFPMLYMAEMENFANLDRLGDDVVAAMMLRAAGEMELVRLLHQRRITVTRIHDTAGDLILKIVLTFKIVPKV